MRIIKRILLVLLLIGICIGCSACQSMQKVNENESVESALFSAVEDYAYGRVIVDNKTGVMYWMSGGSYNTETLTLLVDENGNPKIFEGR